MGQKSDTNNNITNIYLFNILINKYHENPPRNFNDKIVKIGEIKRTDEYNQLSLEDQAKLFTMLMGQRY